MVIYRVISLDANLLDFVVVRPKLWQLIYMTINVVAWPGQVIRLSGKTTPRPGIEPGPSTGQAEILTTILSRRRSSG